MSETKRESGIKTKGYYNNNNNNNNDMNSPNESLLMRYLRSGTPSSPSPNHSRSIGKSGSSRSSSSGKSPLSTVKSLDDDVLVMDGILVDSNKLSSKTSGKFRSSAISDSSSNSGGNLYKTEICVSWETSGTCRYGHKCQFAHGKEELRPIPNRARSKINSDYVLVDPYYSPQSSTSSNSSKLAADTMSNSKLAVDTHTMSSTSSSAAKEAAISKFSKLQIQQKKDTTPTLSPNVTSAVWSPFDDGIIPSSTNEAPVRKAVDDHINRVLYLPAQKKRLPVFVNICPE